MKKVCKLTIAPVFIFIFLSLFSFGFSYVHAQSEQVASQLQTTNAVFNQAFESVSDAEKAGANVTNLLNQLNGAADLLAQAETAYRNNNFTLAATKLDGAVLIAQQVHLFAQDAKQQALADSQNSQLFTVLFSIVGSAIFVVIIFLVWRWFKRRYINNILKAKPEVLHQ